MGHRDPIRETDDGIEIDVKKGQWPFLKMQWAEEEATGKIALLIAVDSNEGGQVVNDGAGIGIIPVSKKKARAIRDFLDRTLDEFG